MNNRNAKNYTKYTQTSQIQAIEYRVVQIMKNMSVYNYKKHYRCLQVWKFVLSVAEHIASLRAWIAREWSWLVSAR